MSVGSRSMYSEHECVHSMDLVELKFSPSTIADFSLESRSQRNRRHRQYENAIPFFIPVCSSITFPDPLASQLCYSLFIQLHNTKITSKAFKSDAPKSSSSCQGQKFVSSSFLSSWILSHHNRIDLGSCLSCSRSFRRVWNYGLHNDYFPVIWNGFVAIFQ